MTNHQPEIIVDHIHQQYQQLTALNDVNLTIHPGEFLALVGMSGGGKSTLLRLIAGLERPSQGQIRFDQQPRETAQPVIRVMFQEDRLLPWMTVLDNLSFKSHDATEQTEAQRLLTLVGLTDYATHFPNQLSGGQKQRVALARALMSHPQVLLLDEPLGALDALTRRKMQDLILTICEQQALTTILVTHDVNEAARMADRIVVMKHATNYAEFSGPADHHDAGQVGIVAEDVLAAILHDQPTTV
ncbi:ABC transporter ATP-binding protein [Levilactobacillus brevis]|uniref:ABC transporter ATP-binding protein n=1 Tax=Levilactobacillus brevis TaxID=1580 RepID=UPI0005B65552|nr:ABC transporter ATP-binding protein [Levilactobacillus brevis]KIR09137.1 sulfonate ABC transporter ATP-binding protein [Levilactobacillus brevis]MCT3566019.1 ABC transporter ATP-binding protein [Levilactobacillus brevis]